MKRIGRREALANGTLWISFNAAAVSLSVLMVAGLLVLIVFKGLGHFWPSALYQLDYLESDGSSTVLVGERVRSESVPAAAGDSERTGAVERLLLRSGNRDLGGVDFRWVYDAGIRSVQTPPDLIVLERRQWGPFMGRFEAFERDGARLTGAEGWQEFLLAVEESNRLQGEIGELEDRVVGRINYQLEKIRLEKRGLQLDEVTDPLAYEALDRRREALEADYRELETRLISLYAEARKETATFVTGSGERVTIELAAVIDGWRPNAMTTFEKIGHFFRKMGSFLVSEPREANTEGGIFPAIFGTVLMVLLMTVVVAPFGVVAAIYLSEYARQDLFTRIIRVTVSNLAGVPSIVYGVFGLGIFVYALGGGIDRLFFEPRLPAPTFGTGGLIWASLTLALLTLPVVIVSTEEGLSRIPRDIREGSLALGATRWETLWNTVLPMASPGIITGLILAVARAAGEVAPLMLVGVVKLAPSLPIDGNFPFIHLERKFMHLGFHIYDVGLQSPNVEATKPVVFATAFFLIAVVLLLNLVALYVRGSLARRNRGLG